MINKVMNDIIKERKEKHIEDYYGIQNCWNKMIDVLSKDIDITVEYLENCTENELYYISEVFEDISEQLHSEKYIECLIKLEKKFPDLDMEYDIELAKNYM